MVVGRQPRGDGAADNGATKSEGGTVRYRIEHHDLDGLGSHPTRVYDLAPHPNYWPAVTDVPCPGECGGIVRWAEAGYVPGYRICGGCGRHYMASGTSEAPTLLRVGTRRDAVAV